MKKVFSNSDLAHTYAQQSQNEGRNSNGSFYFRDVTLYSYGSHFAICKFVKNEQEQERLLFTLRTYSNTTAKQISLARNATSHENKIFCYYPDGTHADNFKAWINEAENVATKLQKAKKPEIYLNQLGHISHYATAYADFLGVVIPETLQTLLNIKEKSQFAEYASKKAELKEIEEKRKAKEAKINFKESFKKWLACEVPYLYNRLNFDFLRINDGRIDTTQGVKIPLELGKRLYQNIKTDTLKVGDKVLNFEVNEVGDKIRIGCHTFTKKYLLQFGAKLA